MELENLIDEIEFFKRGLMNAATGGSIPESEYRRLRELVTTEISEKTRIPDFIRFNRTPMEFQKDMQGRFQHYNERRSFITKEMNTLIAWLEENYMISDPFQVNLKLDELGVPLGQGGFGQVYKWHNDVLDMDFAIKVFNPVFVLEDEQVQGEARFFREAKMLFNLTDKHIVRIFDVGRIKGKPYIKMEYIEGYDLNGLHEKFGNLKFNDAKRIIIQILEGLIEAHANGIIHRDLKPANIMFQESIGLFKIIDFGISAFIETDNITRLTKTGETVAGGNFSDPELQTNPKLRDCRSDIYSVGAILYFLLCGRAPGGSDMEQYLVASNERLTERQKELVLKCLSGQLNERYKNCQELLMELEQL